MRVLFFLLLVITTSSYAQTEFSVTDTMGSIMINRDSRIEMLALKQAEINKRASKLSSSGQYRGYRVQVYNSNNRDEANSVKSDLLRRFPDQKSYLLYQSPNFRVRIGNFLTQKEAMDLRKILAALYPNRGIYIVQDLIEYTPVEDEDLL
ncbi:SPOR domain-containing protein [Aridibaculum aurantiacum]|uniref:SPOR domain-containing protein n=1 Tax=Aridibaculum aurantiacum TaxID=2810307 RepID=UPI001A956573|nr:SPOR domain-containing protein [Aridibaculum aurantiacum]